YGTRWHSSRRFVWPGRTRSGRDPCAGTGIVRRQEGRGTREGPGRRNPELQDSLEGRRQKRRREEVGTGFVNSPQAGLVPARLQDLPDKKAPRGPTGLRGVSSF